MFLHTLSSCSQITKLKLESVQLGFPGGVSTEPACRTENMETWVQSQGWEGPRRREQQSARILAWRNPTVRGARRATGNGAAKRGHDWSRLAHACVALALFGGHRMEKQDLVHRRTLVHMVRGLTFKSKMGSVRSTGPPGKGGAQGRGAFPAHLVLLL